MPSRVLGLVCVASALFSCSSDRAEKDDASGDSDETGDDSAAQTEPSTEVEPEASEGTTESSADTEPAEQDRSSGAECDPTADLTYASFGREFMTAYCTRCHSSAFSGLARGGAPPQHNFDTLEGILASAEAIDQNAAAGPRRVNETMPPVGSRPSLDERRQLGAWLACEHSDEITDTDTAMATEVMTEDAMTADTVSEETATDDSSDASAETSAADPEGPSGDAGGADGGVFLRQHLLLDEGFEGSDPFAAFSIDQACCEHTITASTEQARDGVQSFRAEVRVGDPAVSSGYRAELTLPDFSDVGNKWYGFAVYFEAPTEGSDWIGNNGHFVQWHPDNSSGSASLGLWSYGDGWRVGLNPEGDSSADFELLDQPILANRWHDVVLHVDWELGVVQFWLNGELEVDTAELDYAGGPGQYMKLGINRWGEGEDGAPTEHDWVIYYDSFRIGDEQASYEDVAP
jgi:hypothetical protein